MFSTSRDLKRHIKNHDKPKNEVQGDHKCDRCGKFFTRSGSLKIHIRNVHEGQRNYKCDHCEKCYAHSQNLKDHIRTVHQIININNVWNPLLSLDLSSTTPRQ